MRLGPPRAANRAAGAVLLVVCALLLAAVPAAGSPRVRPAAEPGVRELARADRFWSPARMRRAAALDAPSAAAPLAQASFLPVTESSEPRYAVNGRLFLVQGRQAGFCSATAIDSPSRRLVITAAHCLNSGPRGRRGGSIWSRLVKFVPAFEDGRAPFGAFIARRNGVFVPRQWQRFGNSNYDVGAILTSPNKRGKRLADAVGGVEIALDRPRQQQGFETFGYPGESKRLQGCRSPYVGDDSLTYRIPGPPTVAIRCRWAPGASGGGWLIDDATAINGLTSYGKPRDPVHTFGPYFSRRNVGALVKGM